jgi:beta-galactosidase
MKPLDIAAGQKKQITLPLKPLHAGPDKEYYLKVTFSLAEDTPWAKKGHIVAWDQMKISGDAPSPTKFDTQKMPAAEYNEDAKKITVVGKDFNVVISKDSGAIESYTYRKHKLLSGPLVPNFWRVPIDSDIRSKTDKTCAQWKDAAQKRNVKNIAVKQAGPQSIQIAVDFVLPSIKSEYKNVYTVFGNGQVAVEVSILPDSNLPELLRFGMQMEIPNKYNNMKWYGRGPQETYQDRKTGAAVGIWSADINDNISNYIRPQEYGNKTDVRWISLTDKSGKGLTVYGMPTIDASAWPYTMEDLEKAKHQYELPKRNNITVNIDYKQRGIGGVNSWGALPHDEYRLFPKPYIYKFCLKP